MSPLDEDQDLSREFSGPSDLGPLDRRQFMKYLGLFSSMGLLSNCVRQAEYIVPYVKEVPEFAKGNYEFYTSAFSCEGFAQGIIVKSHQGRPVKIEGNPDHPSSLGSTGAQAQAALYELYHPGRAKGFKWDGKKLTLRDLKERLAEASREWGAGSGVVFALPPEHSPTIKRLMEQIKLRHPKARWSTLSPWSREHLTTYDLYQANTVVSFDEELFDQRPDHLRLARDFMRRRLEAINANSEDRLNRLIVFHSAPYLASAKADASHLASQEEIWNEACDLLWALQGKETGNEKMKRLAASLKSRGKGVVSVSPSLGQEAAELEAAINAELGTGLARTRSFALPFDLPANELKALVRGGKVHTLVLLDTDPLYWDEEWRPLFPLVKQKIGLALFETETFKHCNVQLALGHFLEQWGDLENHEKDIAIQQPLIEPLFPSLSAVMFLGALAEDSMDGQSLVKKTHPMAKWEEALRSGLLKAGASSEKTFSLKSFQHKKAEAGWKLRLLPDPALRYGQYANNPVLQELPKHFSRITWSNAFYLSLVDGKELQLKDGDVLRLKTDKGDFEAPVWISPLVPARHIVTTLGHGQKAGTAIAKGRGLSAWPLFNARILKVEKTRKHRKLATAGALSELGKFPPVVSAALPLPDKIKKEVGPKSLYPEHPLPFQEQGPQWGMTIDLTSCIGCQACVVACQVENNVPFVGEDQVRKDRLLHWLRVDTYHEKDKVFFQPVPCMHCEKAPCEVVCPVNATVHGNGGLNEMVYNRCVGTRYCSNNCPYKVRRFNFRAYSALKSPWNLGFNPEVSVRDRGVMEKCTYCIQRIKHGERSGEKVTTACQQVCPTRAIEFSDLRDQDAAAVKNKKGPRNYDLLEEEGTKPRTSYLKVIRAGDDGRKT